MWLELPEGEHYSRRLLGEDLIQQLWIPRHRPGNEPAADPCIPRCCELLLEPIGVAITAADDAEPACIGDGGSKPPARDHVHGRQKNWMLDSELLREPCPQTHCASSPEARRPRIAAGRGAPRLKQASLNNVVLASGFGLGFRILLDYLEARRGASDHHIVATIPIALANGVAICLNSNVIANRFEPGVLELTTVALRLSKRHGFLN